MSELLELAAKCEQATGPDGRLDASIWLAAVADETGREAVRIGREQYGDAEAEFRLSRMMDGLAYTASLDAAMTLVPEGFRLFNLGEARYMTRSPAFAAQLEIWTSVDGVDGSGRRSIGVAETAPLALCAAALRARSSLDIDVGEGKG